MSKSILGLTGTAILSIISIGCSGGSQPVADSGSISGSAYVAKSEPAGAVSVGDARQSSNDTDEIVLVGRIGGSTKPFVEGAAAFTIVDTEIPCCADEEGCPTPWDYCCTQNQVKSNIATVKIVDPAGKLVAEDARKLLGVKELNVVVVHGRAKRDSEGNLAVLADQLYVKE